MTAHARIIYEAHPKDGAAEVGEFVPADTFVEISGSPAGMAADAMIFAFARVGKYWWERQGVYVPLCDDVQAKEEEREVLPDDVRKLDEASANVRSSFAAALETVPQTLEGLRAQLQWIRQHTAAHVLPGELLRAFVASALASPALADRG